MDITLHTRQADALQCGATEILYGGAAGGGKSHLMRALALLVCASVPGVQVYLFRRHYADLYKNHMEGPSGFPTMLQPLGRCARINESKNFIAFGNGSKIHLCHLQHRKDLNNYHGAEMHLLLMDELTHFVDAEYRFLRNRVRLGGLQVPANPLNLRLPMIVGGSNPGNIGHNWVKRTFVDHGPWHKHQAPSDEGGMVRCFIPSRVEDNPTLLAHDPGYLDRLSGLGDPALVKAMREGDWNIVAGGALDDVWSDELIVPRFRVPAGWRIDRSFDWGSSHPFSVGWWAEANGEEVTINGQPWAFPRGTLIRIHEWYGTRKAGSNDGIKLSASEIAEGIKAREQHMLAAGWIAGKVRPGPADGQIYQVTQSDTDTIAAKMARHGITWTRADKSPGSRINGLELVRERMRCDEGPGLYFMEHCRAAISTLPILPRSQSHPEDVDSAAEDHIYDEVRYRVLAAARRTAGNIEVRMYGS